MSHHVHVPTQYLCELAMLNGDPYLKYTPSVVAASSLCLARHTLQQQAWVSQSLIMYMDQLVRVRLGLQYGGTVYMYRYV